MPREPMPLKIRPYEAQDFAALYKLDQSCFVPGISYSKWVLQYYLRLPGVDCQVAVEGKSIVGFVLGESNPPLGHIITLDVSESHRRAGIGSRLLGELEKHFAFRGVRSVLLETAVDNQSGIAFWERHGYCTEAVLKRYYLGKIDAYEMRKLLKTGLDDELGTARKS
ncbi:MAG TPA: N-acetyltransferase [Candidatus Acidoferrum sp.]|nr:N-acetyltransferase [Candidatus Acidoferrum sp.]